MAVNGYFEVRDLFRKVEKKQATVSDTESINE